MMDQFARTRQLLGDDAMEKITAAKVAVFGLGAVGSFVAESLSRTGVGSMFLVDFDQVDISNINRQLYALHSTVGKKKAEIAKQRILDINPACEVQIRDNFVNADSLGDLLDTSFDVLVDAIDGLNAKVNLLVEARNLGMAIVSSMGAGGRRDVSKIQVADISQTSVCPLARVVRRRLHRRGVYEGIETVFSVEAPLNKQPFKAEDSVDVLKTHGRKRPPIGTVSWIPGIFGLTIAARVIEQIIAE